MSSLHSKKVADVLDRLFEEAEVEDPPRFERLQTEFPDRGQRRDEAGASRLLAEIFMPVDRAGGRFLYCLARAQGSRLIVEFGTSFGISTIHLAAAARDNGDGRVVTTEMEPGKVKRAREHLRGGRAARSRRDPRGRCPRNPPLARRHHRSAVPRRLEETVSAGLTAPRATPATRGGDRRLTTSTSFRRSCNRISTTFATQ